MLAFKGNLNIFGIYLTGTLTRVSSLRHCSVYFQSPSICKARICFPSSSSSFSFERSVKIKKKSAAHIVGAYALRLMQHLAVINNADGRAHGKQSGVCLRVHGKRGRTHHAWCSHQRIFASMDGGIFKRSRLCTHLFESLKRCARGGCSACSCFHSFCLTPPATIIEKRNTHEKWILNWQLRLLLLSLCVFLPVCVCAFQKTLFLSLSHCELEWERACVASAHTLLNCLNAAARLQFAIYNRNARIQIAGGTCK